MTARPSRRSRVLLALAAGYAALAATAWFRRPDRGPCVFLPMEDVRVVQAVLDGWVGRHALGTVVDWNLAFDREADLRLTVTSGVLHYTWALSPSCEPVDIEAEATGFSTGAPSRETARGLVRGLPVRTDNRVEGRERFSTKLLVVAAVAWTLLVVLVALRRRIVLRRIGAGVALSAAALVIALLGCEGLARLLHLEDRFVLGSLFWVTGVEFVEDPFLHYRPLRPLRRDSDADADAGAVRIQCFGGSTMWGAGARDDETIAARMEARLNEDLALAGSRGLRVDNFGVPGYTLGQAARLAREQLAAGAPDLIVVQIHNRGRRPFLGVPGVTTSFPRERPGVDVDFFVEQFPVPSWPPLWLHRFVLAHSALYRSCVAASTHLFPPSGESCALCDEISQREARALSAEAQVRGVPVVYVAIPSDGPSRPDAAYLGLSADRFIDLYRPGREPDFYEVHPPVAILDEWAAMLVDEIRARHLLPAKRNKGKAS